MISAVKREHESHSLLEADPSAAEMHQSIPHQESALLQLQCQLKSLQSLGSAFTKQSAAKNQGMADYHSARTAARLDKNTKRLHDQQSACNALLQELQQTAARLKALSLDLVTLQAIWQHLHQS